MTIRLIRRASSLILLSKCSTPSSAPTYKHWKNTGAEDYAVTLLKRSSKIKFMPEAVVFPGGTYNAADSDKAWLDLFEKCGVSRLQIKDRFRQPDALRTETYKNLAKEMSPGAANDSEENSVCPELALRLTALRETFEETGLLLTQQCINGVPHHPLAITEHGSFPVLEDGRAENVELGGRSFGEWRTAVTADANKFLDLFTSSSDKRKTLLPWVDGLVEWWAWLTPLTYTKLLFDTIFYTALLPAFELQPTMLSPCNESSQLLVIRPSEVTLAGGSWIAPPQMYEFGRLANFRRLEQLQEHVKRRTGTGGSSATAAVRTWQPQLFVTTDGAFGVIPGDSWYSEDYSVGQGGERPLVHCDLETSLSRPASDRPHLLASPEDAEAALKAHPGQKISLNRFASNRTHKCIFYVNVGLDLGQVTPLEIDIASEDAMSSL